MLVISRMKDQRLTITVPPRDVPQTIEVVVCEFRGPDYQRKVRLGFEAAREIQIVRDDAIRREPAEVKA